MSRAVSEALFRAEGDDVYVPGARAGSPWREGFLHGGPVCGLAAHVAAGCVATSRTPLRVPARLAVDLHSRVPMEPLRTTARFAREGRRIALLDVRIETADAAAREVARASALFVSPIEAPAHQPTGRIADAPAGPEGLETTAIVPASVGATFPPGFHREAEVRWARGPGTDQPAAWMRVPMPLVAGAPLTAFERVATLSDLANGVASVTQRRGGSEPIPYINPETTLYLVREARGEWLGLALESITEEAGVGIAAVTLFDEAGALGRVLSTRVANPRS